MSFLSLCCSRFPFKRITRSSALAFAMFSGIIASPPTRMPPNRSTSFAMSPFFNGGVVVGELIGAADSKTAPEGVAAAAGEGGVSAAARRGFGVFGASVCKGAWRLVIRREASRRRASCRTHSQSVARPTGTDWSV